MAEAKLFIPWNATKCLWFPPHVLINDKKYKYTELPPPHLITSYVDPTKRNSQRNEFNVLQPPVDFDQLDVVMDAVNDDELDGFDGDWERGCCLVHGSKTNDKFDIKCICPICGKWFHSSCLYYKYKIPKSEITHIAAQIDNGKINDLQWKCPFCVAVVVGSDDKEIGGKSENDEEEGDSVENDDNMMNTNNNRNNNHSNRRRRARRHNTNKNNQNSNKNNTSNDTDIPPRVHRRRSKRITSKLT